VISGLKKIYYLYPVFRRGMGFTIVLPSWQFHL